MELTSSQCEICAKKGIFTCKRWRRLNFDEAIIFCDNMECSDLQNIRDITSIIKPYKMIESSINSPISENTIPQTLSTPTVNSFCQPNNSINTTTSSTDPGDRANSLLNELFANEEPNDVFDHNNLVNTQSDIVSPVKNKRSKQNEIDNDEQQNSTNYPARVFAITANELFRTNPIQERQPQFTSRDVALDSRNNLQSSVVENCSVLTPISNNSANNFNSSNVNVVTSVVSSNISTISINNVTDVKTMENSILPKQILPVVAPVCAKVKFPNELIMSYMQTELTKYPQWTNKDALCWLDVTLNLIVHNSAVKKEMAYLSDDSIVKTLYTAYQQVVTVYNSNEYKSQLSLALPENATRENVEKTMLYENKIDMLMETIRDRTFEHLKIKLRCMRGQEESPVFSLPHLLQEEAMQKLFSTHYKLEFQCDLCKFQESRSTQKVILTLPRVCSEFSVTNAFILASCLNCKGRDQKRRVKFDRLPPCVLMHFVEGLPHSQIDRYDFEFQNYVYRVTSIVQYKRNPNHFIAWVRDMKDNLWMECDDLKPGPSCFHLKSPDIPDASECHLLVWERITSNNEVTSLSNLPVLDFESLLDHTYCGTTAEEMTINEEIKNCDMDTIKDNELLVQKNNEDGSNEKIGKSDLNLTIPNNSELIRINVTQSPIRQDLVKNESVNNFETFSDVLNLNPEPPVTIPNVILDSGKVNTSDTCTSFTKIGPMPNSINQCASSLVPNMQMMGKNGVESCLPDVAQNQITNKSFVANNPRVTVPSQGNFSNAASNQIEDQYFAIKNSNSTISNPNSTIANQGSLLPSVIQGTSSYQPLQLKLSACTLVATPESGSGFSPQKQFTLSCESAIELLKKFNKPVNFVIDSPANVINSTKTATTGNTCQISQVPTSIYQDPGLSEFINQCTPLTSPSNRRGSRRARGARNQTRASRRGRRAAQKNINSLYDGDKCNLQEEPFRGNIQAPPNVTVNVNVNNFEIPTNLMEQTNSRTPGPGLMTNMQLGDDSTRNANNASLLQFALKAKNNQHSAIVPPSTNAGCKRKADETNSTLPKNCVPPIVKKISGTGVQLVRNNLPLSRRSSRSFDAYQLKTSNVLEK